MKQHQVVVGLGSNQGDRLQQINSCITLIYKEIAMVVKVSKIYESPAWGFESSPFYNAAVLLHTDLNAEDLLQALLNLEKKLGRTRSDQKGYQARTIDIDIIAFDTLHLETPTLTLPHPLLQDRKFVLQPMLDLSWHWEHPVLKKNIQKLLQETNDDSHLKVVANAIIPQHNIRLSQYNYVAIEGNIGAGKTTLTHKIANDFNAKMILERFADNPFLPKFYEDPNRYAFPLEMSFLADRYQQLSDDLAQFDLFKDFIVADYHLFKSLIFAKVTLQEEEFRLYKTMFDIIKKEMPKPDLYIYLYQNPERLLENIKNRGRNYEQKIEASYLENINKGYLDYIKKQKDIKVLVLDVSGYDFVKNHSDYIAVLEAINEKI